MEALAKRGVPEGSWLFDIGKARRAIADVDDLLRRLERALVEQGPAPSAFIAALVHSLA